MHPYLLFTPPLPLRFTARVLRPPTRPQRRVTRRRAIATMSNEDGDVIPATEWEKYDPATAVIKRTTPPTGAPLPYLRNFPRNTTPPPSRVFKKGSVRIQALCDRIIRIEFATDAHFENRASFTFPLRGAAASGAAHVESNFDDMNAILSVMTPLVRVNVRTNAESFTDGIISAVACTGKDVSVYSYKPSDAVTSAEGLLPGTCRTLDNSDGFVRRSWNTHKKTRDVELNGSILARSPIVFIDDSRRALFTDEGWFAPRRYPNGSSRYRDVYVIASNPEIDGPLDYRAALRAFSNVSGQTPMVPRYFLGNWWSRYYAYDEKSLGDVVKGFETRGAPLSVVIIDMDWHLVDVKETSGPQCNGWTGYTWNKKLFPDPARFLKWLHSRGLGTALNLHPADGVWRHEARYEEYAKFLGAVEMAKRGEPIPFDLSDELSAAAYFKVLLHHHEEMGDYTKSFWWIDWQQGAQSKMEGVDPLFMLNHLHFIDLGRDDRKRPAVFSRFAGLGSHRYPIGFSGDTWATWETLSFQVYMTASSANANYHWWSHDIGGHTRDIPNNGELYARWVQFGVLSPIMRLHSSNNPFIHRNPWAYSADVCNAAVEAMRLRHRLVPYLFSMARRAHVDALPLVMPMYYTHSDEEAAFATPGQYWFGSELIAAPFVMPSDNTTNLSRQAVWLPAVLDGVRFDAPWRHLQTGEAMMAGAFHTVYGSIDCLPLFAKPGAIIPMTSPPKGEGQALNSVQNPEIICLTAVAGANGAFELFEDEETGARQFVTAINMNWKNDTCTLSIAPPTVPDSASTADIDGVIPNVRTWELSLMGVTADAAVSYTIGNGNVMQISPIYDTQRECMTFTIADVPTMKEIHVNINATSNLLSMRDRRAEKVSAMLHTFAIGREVVWRMSDHIEEIVRDISALPRLSKNDVQIKDRMGTYWTLSPQMKQAIYEIVTGSGCNRAFLTRQHAPAVVWSGIHDSRITVDDTPLRSYRVFWPKMTDVRVTYADVVHVTIPLGEFTDNLNWPDLEVIDTA